MKAKEIYDILRAGGLSRAGALGMLGNMAAESGLKENIAQRGMTKLSDEQYTAAADNGLIDFVNDSVGFGLYQVTFNTRKKGLLEMAKSYGVSVGDGALQCDYALFELRRDYPDLMRFLCTTDDIDLASDRICMEFERPAVNNLQARRGYAHSFEDEITESSYHPPIKDPIQATFPPDPTVLALQLWLNYNGYACETNGYKSGNFFSVMEKFIADMKNC